VAASRRWSRVAFPFRPVFVLEHKIESIEGAGEMGAPEERQRLLRKQQVALENGFCRGGFTLAAAPTVANHRPGRC
jgi:hypothetical protein